MDVQNLVSKMIAQHRGLQKDLGTALDLSSRIDFDAAAILQSLEVFKKDLIEHLELENGTFYVGLLKKMREKGWDTANTELFIKEMDVIAKTVMDFLNKYSGSDSITSSIAGFKQQLPEIINTLNLRIESEESGVYSYWGLF